MFVGTFDLIQYHTETLVLEPSDKLVLYTDGVNEAFSANGEEYGNARLEAFLVDHSDRTPKELTEGLRADVAAWAMGAEQSDDITILVLEYKGA
jgi:sigma-B regulation protein RsbU (phosphoserine phosphatase)